MFNIGKQVSSYIKLMKHGLCKLIEFTWCLILIRLSKMKLMPSFGVYRFVEKLHFGYSDAYIGHPHASLDQSPGTAPLIRIISYRHCDPTL